MALFTDGEPLDVAKLNKMATDLDTLKAQFQVMTNAYNAANKNTQAKVPIIETGYVTVGSINAGTYTYPININGNGTFGTGEYPYVVATPRSTLKSGQLVTVSIINVSSTSPSLIVTTNQNITNANFRIDWIAIYMKNLQA